MSLVQGIRNSLSNNRGKIGLAAGVGSTIAAQNYIKENPALVNQAEYNIMAKGNNLLSPVTGKQEISHDIQDNVNGYYNHLQENPKNILGIDRPVLQGEDAYNLSQGIQTFTNNVKDFPKSVQDVFENQTLIVPIKDMILEGYSYEEILEAINAKKVAAAALIGATAASPFVAGHIAKTVNKPIVSEQKGSIGKESPDSKLKKLGVVAPAKQLEKGQLTNYFNNKK